MCGINGFFSKTAKDKTETVLFRMKEATQNRGPDANSIWQDKQTNLFLGHCRLAIQDISSAGSQPMMFESERYVIVFNEEIYNYLALRKELHSQGLSTSCSW